MENVQDIKHPMSPGDVVYDINGAELNFIAEVPGHGYLVQKMFTCDDGEPYEGEPMIRGRVWPTAPVQRIQADVAKREAELADVIAKLREERQALSNVEKEYANRLKKLSSRSEALARIEDFLDGKITHYVAANYGDIKIIPIENADASDCDWTRKRDLKLLTLFGNTNGSLSWGLNWYSDGSGSSTTVYPCVSLDEAKSKVVEIIAAVVAEWRERRHEKASGLRGAAKAAAEYGIPFPEDVAEWMKDEATKSMAKRVAEKQADLDKAITEYNAIAAAKIRNE